MSRSNAASIETRTLTGSGGAAALFGVRELDIQDVARRDPPVLVERRCALMKLDHDIEIVVRPHRDRCGGSKKWHNDGLGTIRTFEARMYVRWRLQ
ncbi:MAG: hypothetical protein JO099_10980 [Acidobacteriia bacterium]|nr:hypothetical protein [Terriglobia bacterium]